MNDGGGNHRRQHGVGYRGTILSLRRHLPIFKNFLPHLCADKRHITKFSPFVFLNIYGGILV